MEKLSIIHQESYFICVIKLWTVYIIRKLRLGNLILKRLVCMSYFDSPTFLELFDLVDAYIETVLSFFPLYLSLFISMEAHKIFNSNSILINFNNCFKLKTVNKGKPHRAASFSFDSTNYHLNLLTVFTHTVPNKSREPTFMNNLNNLNNSIRRSSKLDTSWLRKMTNRCYNICNKM